MQKNIDYLDNGVFSTSKVYEHAIGVLDINNCITIIGPPGSGKTITALQLARRKCGKDGKSKLYFCQNFEEISHKADGEHNTYIVMDDWIDHYVYYPSTLPEAVKCLDKIYGDLVKRGNVHLILTAQEDKWKKFSDILKGGFVFNPQRLVRLDFKKPNKKQLKERQDMIQRHFKYFDIIEENSEKREDQTKKSKTVFGKDVIDKSAKVIDGSAEKKSEQKEIEEISKKREDHTSMETTVIGKDEIGITAKQIEERPENKGKQTKTEESSEKIEDQTKRKNTVVGKDNIGKTGKLIDESPDEESEQKEIEESSETREDQTKIKKTIGKDVIGIPAKLIEESPEKKGEQKEIDGKIKSVEIIADTENCAEKKLDENGKKVVKKGSIVSLAEKIKPEDVFSFPVMIDLICRNERLLMAKDLIFKDGFTYILNLFFKKWSMKTDVNEKRSFCVLVFAALLGGEINFTDFSSLLTGPLYKRICTEHDLYLAKVTNEENKEKQKSKTENSIENIEPDSEERLLMNNCRLKSCLYRISREQGNTSFVLQHNSLLRFILSFVKNMKGETFLIENAHFGVLLNMCWLDNTLLDKFKMKSIPEGSICFSVNSYKPLAKRIRLEMLQGYRLPQWQDHVFRSHKTFREVWIKELENTHEDVQNVAH